MPPSPPRISARALRGRRNRIARLAARLGFVGRVEYRHVYSKTGGASYGQAATPDQDLLTVYAEAFERDADPNDFSLNAILAHERGHQLLVRRPRLAAQAVHLLAVGEEVVASVLGAIICRDTTDEEDLSGKAVFDLIARGVADAVALRMVLQMKGILESLL
ncbi:MAG: hypothetical protein J2P46_04355 [Zavarzinella sp.]|nr:hypothetical protein [Zavarzinella sp.]